MAKYVPLLSLAVLVSTVVVAAPKPPVKEGLVSHEATGKAYVVRTLPDRKNPEWWKTTSLKVRYILTGLPGETYTVELWIGLPDEPVKSQRGPGHFDTQEVTVPGAGTKLIEVKGVFDRRSQDGPDVKSKDVLPPWFEMKPGTCSLVGPGLGGAWECRLVVKRKGKTLTDTGYFQVVLPPVVEV
jgi:hypothetical protein